MLSAGSCLAVVYKAFFFFFLSRRYGTGLRLLLFAASVAWASSGLYGTVIAGYRKTLEQGEESRVC